MLRFLGGVVELKLHQVKVEVGDAVQKMFKRVKGGAMSVSLRR